MKILQCFAAATALLLMGCAESPEEREAALFKEHAQKLYEEARLLETVSVDDNLIKAVEMYRALQRPEYKDAAPYPAKALERLDARWDDYQSAIRHKSRMWAAEHLD